MKLLLIEDEKEMARTLKEGLQGDYVVELAFSGEDGDYFAHIDKYDGIVLDLHLPDISGVEVCQKLRKDGIKTPILMLTAEGDFNKKIDALDAGVDDYLTKPFKFEELKARIRALLRRNPTSYVSNVLRAGGLTLDATRKIVTRDGTAIRLKRKEFQLLEYFMRNPGKVITRDMILEHIWDSSYESMTNTIDVHVKYLRDQIDKPFRKKMIRTVYGFGYKLEA